MDAPAAMRFAVLGGLRVLRDGHEVDLGGPKQRAVLAGLLVDLGRPVPVDRLLHQVWGERPPPRAETSLQAYVSNLRRVVEPGRKPREAPQLLVTRAAGYALLASRDQVDAARMEDLAASGHELLLRHDPDGAAAGLDEALALWAGPLLPELAGEPWVDEAATRLAEVRAQAVEDRAEAGLALGRHASLVPGLEAAVAEEPFRERRRAQLALALYRCGRQRDALTALADARRTLVEEVGIEPSAELRRLEADILAQSPDLDPAPRRASHPGPARVPPPAPAPTRDGPAPDPEPDPSGDAGDAGHRFVGRARELAQLQDAYRAAAAGSGRPLVVCGEPGIGKTRLVEELVASVPGATVAWARCPESAAQAAYWPCIQLGRQLEGADVVDGALLGPLLPADDVQPSLDPSADRLSLHLAVAKVLASARRPLVLVIDDLQWADPASLRVVEFVASELGGSRVLLVVTTRPVTPDASAPLVDCLGELARQPGTVRVDLLGLDEAEVEAWLGDRVADPEGRRLAPVVHHRTGGNPFFVGEVVELLASGGDPGDLRRRATAVPAAVQDAVRRRVGRLPAGSQRLLTTAAVVGRVFDVDLVAAVEGTGLAEVMDALDPALVAGLLVESDVPGRFEFAHSLVADTLTSELTAVRRARLHAATAGALEALRAADLDHHLHELAHHSFEGAAAGTAEAAYRWAVRAARAAAAGLAHEDAALHWRRAVRCLELAHPADGRARYEALHELACAHLGADAMGPAYEALVAAIDLAVALGEPDLVARSAAATCTDGLWFAGEIGLTNVDSVAALERALDAMDDAPSVERALALGALAENAYWRRPVGQLDDRSAEAVAVARATGDPEALARTLHKRIQAMWWSGTLDVRAAAAAELLELAGEAALHESLRATALFDAAAVSWDQGDVPGAALRLGAARDLAGRTGSPSLITQLDFFRVAIEVWRGRLDVGDRLLDETYELYRRTRRWAAEPFRAAFKTSVWMEQDRADDIATVAPVILDSEYGPWFREAYGLALTELGRLDEAAALLEGDLPPLGDSWLHLGVLTAGAHSRVTLGDRRAARILRDHLAPYAGRLATAGTAMAFGDVDLVLARIEHLLGNDASARRHADASVTRLSAAGAGPWLVRALLVRAEVGGDDADRRRAAELVGRMDLPLLARAL